MVRPCYHVSETIGNLGPWLTGYHSYRVTELCFRRTNDRPAGAPALGFTWLPGQMEIMGLEGKQPCTMVWGAQ